MFVCETAKLMWVGLGMVDVIESVTTTDRSGSVILLLCDENKPLSHGFALGKKKR
jgi:hypothetical protein